MHNRSYSIEHNDNDVEVITLVKYICIYDDSTLISLWWISVLHLSFSGSIWKCLALIPWNTESLSLPVFLLMPIFRTELKDLTSSLIATKSISKQWMNGAQGNFISNSVIIQTQGCTKAACKVQSVCRRQKIKFWSIWRVWAYYHSSLLSQVFFSQQRKLNSHGQTVPLPPHAEIELIFALQDLGRVINKNSC